MFFFLCVNFLFWQWILYISEEEEKETKHKKILKIVYFETGQLNEKWLYQDKQIWNFVLFFNPLQRRIQNPIKHGAFWENRRNIVHFEKKK